MSIANGQNANQTTFNDGFMSRTVDTDTVGKVEFKDTTEAGSNAGSVRIQGGLYVAKKLYFSAVTDADGAGAAAIYTAGGLHVTKKIYVADTTDATSSAGSIRTAGGVQVAKKVHVGSTTDAADDAGALNVQGGIFAKTNLWVKTHATILNGIEVEMVADTTTTGSDQSAGLQKPLTTFTNVGLTSINNFTKSFGSGSKSNIVMIHNGLAAPITIKNNSGGTASNRIITGTGTDLIWSAGMTLLLVYDTVNSRWRIVGGTGSGGGGTTAAPLRWEESANSPLKTFESGVAVYEFELDLSQELYAAFRVPESYIPGSPIVVSVQLLNASTSGDMLLSAQSTLIRAGVDEITSTTNQRTSTNSAVAMSSSNDNEIQTVDLDVTSSIGEINSTAVSAGDLIKVRLYEAAANTVATPVRLIIAGTEVSFS